MRCDAELVEALRGAVGRQHVLIAGDDQEPYFERPTQPADLVEAGEGAAEGGGGEVDVFAALVADGEAPEAVQPRQGALHPPAVAAEAGAALDAAPGDAGPDAAPAALGAAGAVVAALVGARLVRPPPRAAPAPGTDRRHRAEGRRQHRAVVAVGGAERQAERRAMAVHDDVALGARPAAIGRVRPGR
jgi:hypothetical protein